jgi:hypothetical protein
MARVQRPCRPAPLGGHLVTTFVRTAVVGVFGLFMLAGFSQSAAAQQLGGGVAVGVNVHKARLSGPETEGVDTHSKNGLLIGGFVSLPIAPAIAIMPEVLYSQKHTGLQQSEGALRFSQRLAVDFIQIPVLFKFTPAGGRGFYVVAGPGFNFTTKAKTEDSEFNGVSFPEADEDLKANDDVKGFDFSLIGGAGVAFGKFGVEVRYDGSLTNLNNDDDADDFKVKHSAVTFLARWFIR